MSPRQTPSIYDAPAAPGLLRRHRRGLATGLGGVLLLTAVGGSGWYLHERSQTNPAGSTVVLGEHGQTDGSTEANSGVNASLLLDGWSARILGGSISWRDYGVASGRHDELQSSPTSAGSPSPTSSPSLRTSARADRGGARLGAAAARLVGVQTPDQVEGDGGLAEIGGDPQVGPGSAPTPSASSSTRPSAPGSPTRTPGSSPAGNAQDQITEGADGSVSLGSTHDGPLPGWQRTPLQPLSAQMISVLLRERPDRVAAAVSRMITVSDGVRCDADGCQAGGHLSADDLADPRTWKQFGSVYTGWGVQSLLYTAEIKLPAGDILQVAAPSVIGYPDAPGATLAYSAEAVDGMSLLLRVASTGSASELDGGAHHRWFLSSGFGQVFPTITQWNPVGTKTADTTVDAYTLPAYSGAHAPDVAVGALNPDSVDARYGSEPGVPFASGLPVPTLAATDLSAAQLTYASSVTTGCGAGVLCVPVPLARDSVRLANHTTGAVCNLEGTDTAVDAAPGALSMTVNDLTVHMGLPAPVHQFGAYPAGEAGRTALPGVGLAPPLTRQLDLHVIQALFHAPEDTAFVVSGGAAPLPAGAAATPTPREDVLDAIAVAGKSYSAKCPAAR